MLAVDLRTAVGELGKRPIALAKQTLAPALQAMQARGLGALQSLLVCNQGLNCPQVLACKQGGDPFDLAPARAQVSNARQLSDRRPHGFAEIQAFELGERAIDQTLRKRLDRLPIAFALAFAWMA